MTMPGASRMWDALKVDPFKPVPLRVLLAIVFAYAGTSMLAQLAFPNWSRAALSPLHLAIGLAMLLGLAVSLVNAIVTEQGEAARAYWLASTLAFCGLVVLELLDFSTDRLFAAVAPKSVFGIDIDGTSFTAIALVIFALLFLLRASAAMILALVSIIGFCLLSAMGEEVEDWPAFLRAFDPHYAGIVVQTGMLLAISLFLVAVYQSDLRNNRFGEGPVFFGSGQAPRDGRNVGANARHYFEAGKVPIVARHPPLKAAYYPLLKEITLFAVMAYLLATAGRQLRRATHIPLHRQMLDMTKLWFRHGIDPPTYYAMELFRPETRAGVPHILTRYETKNGVLAALNQRKPNPLRANEMSDKGLFARCCQEAGLAHPATLAVVTQEGVAVQGRMSELSRDLFCKMQRGMGAKHTLAFSFLGDGRYRTEGGEVVSLGDVFHLAASAAPPGKAMLVQPWLRNHQEVADFARDSLITIRVVTCLNERGEPEVTLAMLRLLAKLEPDWHRLADEEYAAPIDLMTGEMGEFLGDNMRTSAIHLTHHPVTGIAVKGRKLENWPALRDFAVRAHRAFMHRVVIGWDIALTPSGPVLLEGNSNFDVMFLQRVHQTPVGLTRLGELLNFHIHATNSSLAGTGATPPLPS